MTSVTTRIERSGPAVRAALAQFAAEECAVFEEQFREALLEAEQRWDLRPAEAVLDRWWGIAAIRANPLNPAERDLVAQARAGDDTGWSDGPAGARARRQVDRYTARWSQIPLEQYAALLPQAQRQVDQRIQELLEHPQGPGVAYDPPSDQWTTTYGDGAGLILYAVVPEHRRVLILRLV